MSSVPRRCVRAAKSQTIPTPFQHLPLEFSFKDFSDTSPQILTDQGLQVSELEPVIDKSSYIAIRQGVLLPQEACNRFLIDLPQYQRFPGSLHTKPPIESQYTTSNFMLFILERGRRNRQIYSEIDWVGLTIKSLLSKDSTRTPICSTTFAVRWTPLVCPGASL